MWARKVYKHARKVYKHVNSLYFKNNEKKTERPPVNS